MAGRDNFSSTVAKHYNQVEQKPIKQRSKSTIIDLRRFNNGMKSILHHLAFKYAEQILQPGEKFNVLDLGCGKGGDLPKYSKNPRVGYVVGVDIANVSIEQCKERYRSMESSKNCFKGEFFVADLSRLDIERKISELNGPKTFHVASTQFSIHYSFETFEQAVRYISNARNNLIRLGVFIGSYPDGPKLLKCARESATPGIYEVEDIMSVEFAPEDLENPQPFGTKYHFKLKEVVDCPEFLVHPQVLEKLMTDMGFFKVFDRSFEETLREAIMNPNDGHKVKNLLMRHEALGFDLDNQKAELSEEMWKAASIYRCFCYRKK